MAVITIPSSLRSFTGGRGRVEVAASTVAEALECLCALHPGLRGALFTRAGALKRSVTAFVGEDDVRALGLAASLAPDADVVLVTAIAGG